MSRIAFATGARWPELTPGDRLLAEVLRARGHEVAPLIWTSPPRRRFDGVLIRSTWDYHLRPAEFAAWVSKTPCVWNSASQVRWNLHKRYLRELETAGVAIVPTLFLEAGVIGDEVFERLRS